MLRRSTALLARTISFPKNPLSLDFDFDSFPLRSRIFYLPPGIAYEAIIPGVFVTNDQS